MEVQTQAKQSVSLSFKNGSSDKVYNVELTQQDNGWVVNFSYGRRGAALTSGTKTKDPVDYEKAEKAYTKLVNSKVAKGYKSEGDGVMPINTVEKVDTGIYPQLLNELTEEDANIFINDPEYCMQEKFDGRRKMIDVSQDKTIIGVNKKGQEIPVIDSMIAECQSLPFSQCIDGEDMGDYMMVFDDIKAGNLPYVDRYMIIKTNLKDCKTLRPVDTAWTTEEKKQMYARLKAERAEGVVFKNINAIYKEGRPASGGDQFKCKFYESASCIVSGHNPTKRSISLDVYDDNDLIDVGNVTVYPNQKMPEIEDIVEIKYLYYNEGGSLYQPVLLGIRDDVDGRECVIDKLKRKKDEQS